MFYCFLKFHFLFFCFPEVGNFGASWPLITSPMSILGMPDIRKTSMSSSKLKHQCSIKIEKRKTSMTANIDVNWHRYFFHISYLLMINKKTGKARIGLTHRGFRTKIGSHEVFLKFKLSLARALSSDTPLEPVAFIPNLVPF